MATRIVSSGRRYGRGQASANSLSSTHLIKIGQKKISSGGKSIPDKLGGFLICVDTLDANNAPVIDYDAMERIGCSRESVTQAKAGGFKDDSLPTELNFVVMRDAVQDGEFWTYPGIYAENYELYSGKGRECYGDGMSATRKQDDGTEKTVVCNPFGKRGCASSEQCGQSGPGKACKYHGRLTVCLLVRSANPAGFEPLSPGLGAQALARFDTTSEYFGMDALQSLDAATERVQGHINGLTGTLTFQKKHRRKGDGAAVVGHVLLQIHEEAIRRREEALRKDETDQFNRMLAAKQSGLALPAPSHFSPSVDVTDAEVVEEPPVKESLTTQAATPVSEQQAKPAQPPQDDRLDALRADIDATDPQDLARALDAFAAYYCGIEELSPTETLNLLTFGDKLGYPYTEKGERKHKAMMSAADLLSAMGIKLSANTQRLKDTMFRIASQSHINGFRWDGNYAAPEEALQDAEEIPA